MHMHGLPPTDKAMQAEAHRQLDVLADLGHTAHFILCSIRRCRCYASKPGKQPLTDQCKPQIMKNAFSDADDSIGCNDSALKVTGYHSNIIRRPMRNVSTASRNVYLHPQSLPVSSFRDPLQLLMWTNSDSLVAD